MGILKAVIDFNEGSNTNICLELSGRKVSGYFEGFFLAAWCFSLMFFEQFRLLY